MIVKTAPGRQFQAKVSRTLASDLIAVSRASEGDAGGATVRAHAGRSFPFRRNRDVGNDAAALIETHLLSIQPHFQLQAERDSSKSTEDGRIERGGGLGKRNHGSRGQTSDLHVSGGVK